MGFDLISIELIGRIMGRWVGGWVDWNRGMY